MDNLLPTPPQLFGPLLIGAFFNSILYGVFLVQVFNKAFSSISSLSAPPIALCIPPNFLEKRLEVDQNSGSVLCCCYSLCFIDIVQIIYLLIIETVNSGLTFGLVYEPLVIRQGQRVALEITPKCLAADPIVTALVSTPVQIFFALRIRLVSNSDGQAIAIIALSLGALVGGISSTVLTIITREFARFNEFRWAIVLWLSSSALADVFITVGLVRFLSKNKKGLITMDCVLNKIIILTVQTGLITSVAAIADMVTFIAVPNTTLMFIWDFSLSKLYSNALLSTLNARAGWNNLIHTDRRKTLMSFIDVEKLNSKLGSPSDHISFDTEAFHRIPSPPPKVQL